MLTKKGIEMSFGWIFALVAGIVIIFLAIFISTKLLGTEQETTSAEVGKEISILLNPLETGFESAQTTSITIPTETRIHNGCDLIDTFGRQSIQLDQKTLNQWVKTNVNVFSSNKYIFSNSEIEGKKFYIFSKPFQFPFKISDLIYMTSSLDTYCFVDAPYDVEEEISNLNQANLLTENCSAANIQVCFKRADCDINVNDNGEYVEKNNEILYFTGTGDDSKALMYAAIFSDKEVYECQLKRLMLRLRELSILYINKEILTSSQGCDENLGADLNTLGNLAVGLNNSVDIGVVKMQVDEVSDKNNVRRCLLW